MGGWTYLAERYRLLHQPWWAVFGIYELLIVGAWLLEYLLLRRIRRASGDPLGAAQTDRRYTLLWLRHLALLQFPLLRAGRWTPPFAYSWTVTGLGILVALLGLAIRLCAIARLRENFTYVVSVNQKQRLVTTGPYRYVRHPAYTGLLLYFTGLGLALSDFYVLLILWTYVGYVVWSRITREERVLADHFGAKYEAWRKRTKLLIPFLF